MDEIVLVLLVTLLVVGVLGVIALKGRITWASYTNKSINKVEIEGGTQRKR